jgi:hypothetical protein
VPDAEFPDRGIRGALAAQMNRRGARLGASVAVNWIQRREPAKR